MRRASFCGFTLLFLGCVQTHANPDPNRGDTVESVQTHDATVGTLVPSAEHSGQKPIEVDAGRETDSDADAATASLEAGLPDSDPCRCTRLNCPVNTQLTIMQGECCPVCQPCEEVSCPAIACGPGLVPLIPKGQCCATACKYADVDPQAPFAISLVPSGLCEPAPAPTCNGNGWPGCSSNWDEALVNYARSCPNVLSSYLARCETHHAIVNTTEYGKRIFFFDRSTGKLVGHQVTVGDEAVSCLAYVEGFTVGDQICEPWVDNCEDQPPIERADAGVELPFASPPSCADGQAAFDAYLAAQLQEHNQCTSDTNCLTTGFSQEQRNPCEHLCDVILTNTAINDQIINRLETFGRAACARCPTRPSCTQRSLLNFGRCVEGQCVKAPSGLPPGL